MLKASVRRSPDSHLVPTKRVVVEPEISPPVAGQGAAVARSAASPSISCQYRCQNRRRDETGSWWTSSGQALIGRQEPGAGVGFHLPRAEWPLAFQKTFSAPNMDDYGGPGQKPITSVIAGAPLGFEPAAVRSSPVRCWSLDAPTMSIFSSSWCGVAHGFTISLICILLWPYGDANLTGRAWCH